MVCVGLAESGRRREEAPQSNLIKVGPESYVGPDLLSLGVQAVLVKEATRSLWIIRSLENAERRGRSTLPSCARFLARYVYVFGGEDEPTGEAGESIASGFASTRFILSRVTPLFVMPISSAACWDRSRLRPRTCGPRSLIRTFTERPVAGLVTITEEPIGRVRDAAVNSSGL